MPRKSRKAKKSRLLPRLMRRGFYWGVVVGLWGLIAVTGIFAWYGAQLPTASSWEVPVRKANVRILAEDGSLLVNRGVGGVALRLEDMSAHIPQAVIAIEDRRFHSHFGFDPIGFARAMVRNAMKGRIAQGGSTLSQQLAKNLFLKPDRTIGRKVQELILALWLETQYSKADILELYLNRVYFGAGAYGVDAAARRYFGKSAAHVSLNEAAMLAGLLKAPSAFSPARHPKRAQSRAKTVLAAMREEGYVRDDAEGRTRPVIVTAHYRSGPEHFIADEVMRQLPELIGEIERDITVRTTISPYLMTAANAELRGALSHEAGKAGARQAALVALSPQGAIRAMIGGSDYARSQFNRATKAKRQPGSAFKPFVWQAAVEAGLRPSDLVTDAPVRLGSWQPVNYDRRYRGPVRLDEALAQSVNTVAVRLIQRTGAKRVASLATRMGVDRPKSADASLALGTSETSLLSLTAAYAPYSNGGLRARPYLIERVERDGRTVWQRKASAPKRVIDQPTLVAMNAMLSGVIANGTGRAARLSRHPVGGKTGTTQRGRDALFVGYSAHLTTGIWFGNDDNTPTKLTGGGVPAAVFAAFMATAHHGVMPKALPKAALMTATLPPPDRIARPTFRPTGRTSRTAPNDNSFEAISQRAKKSILDLLTGS